MSQDPHIIIENHTDDTPRKSNTIVRGAIIVAIILVLLFIALAIVKFVPKLISSIGTANVSFSSLFSPKDKISVSSPTEVKSGSPFTVTWKNNTADSVGSLMWSYKCVDGASVEYNSISGQRPVICDTMFPLPATGESYSFIAKNSNAKDTPITMSVSLWDAEMKNVKIQGGTNMTILANSSAVSTPVNQYDPSRNATTTTTTTTNKNTDTPKPATNVIHNNSNTNTTKTNTGSADLRVTLSKIGRTVNGAYVDSTSFAENDRVTVRFNVANVGSARSGAWTLRADLPTKTIGDKVYTSNAQPSLNPGDSYEMTISFDTFDPNGRNIAITINANDANQSNNVLNIPVTSNGSYPNNNNNNNYNNTGSRSDLVIRIIDVGIMNSNNQFYYSNFLTRNDKVAVKFEIQNIGSQNTGNFRFNANLPTQTADVYQSNTENSLAPGETRQYTIGFNNAITGNSTVSFRVDSDNNVSENDENNNYASRTINVNY